MIQRLLPFLTLIVLFVGLAIASPHFLTNTNLSSVVRQTAVINIMALGMTLIIISGGIDLSVGAILAMGGLLGTHGDGERVCHSRRRTDRHSHRRVLRIRERLAHDRAAESIRSSSRWGRWEFFAALTLIISNGLPVHEIPGNSPSSARATCSACRSCSGSCWCAP